MKNFIAFLLTVSFTWVSFTKPKPQTLSANLNTTQKLYSKHWFGRLPLRNKNFVLVHDIFIISFDTEKKFPTWVAYQLAPSLVWGQLKLERKYKPDPLLSTQYSSTYKHYKGASNCDGKKAGYDKGHLAPLGSFKFSPFAYQAQYLSNIIPQTKKLNQGPWRVLEEKVRAFVKKGNEVRILTGPVYGQEGKDKVPPCWKSAQGQWEEIPRAYWKIVAFQHKSKIKFCPFLMPQKVKNKRSSPKKYTVELEQIEKQTHLKLFEDTKKTIKPDCNFLL